MALEEEYVRIIGDFQRLSLLHPWSADRLALQLWGQCRRMNSLGLKVLQSHNLYLLVPSDMEGSGCREFAESTHFWSLLFLSILQDRLLVACTLLLSALAMPSLSLLASTCDCCYFLNEVAIWQGESWRGQGVWIGVRSQNRRYVVHVGHTISWKEQDSSYSWSRLLTPWYACRVSWQGRDCVLNISEHKSLRLWVMVSYGLELCGNRSMGKADLPSCLWPA